MSEYKGCRAANKAFRQMFYEIVLFRLVTMSGYGSQVLSGESFYEFVHAEDSGNVQQAFQNRKWISG